MTTHIPCPECDTRLPARRLDPAENLKLDTTYTIVCPTCATQFDVILHRNWLRRTSIKTVIRH